MGLIALWRRHRAARPGYFTPAGHRQEAERLAWVIDDVLQSDAQRTIGDLIALARLHLDMATTAEPAAAPVATTLN